MARNFFVGGRDFEELRLRKRAADEFHSDWQLGRRRTDELASVGVRRIGHSIINYFGESGGDNDGRESAFRAQVDAPTFAGASEDV